MTAKTKHLEPPARPGSLQGTADEVSFEEALEVLEALVEKLEGGGHTLEESLASFEQGVRLVRVCSERLDAARVRLAELEQGPTGLSERELSLESGE